MLINKKERDRNDATTYRLLSMLDTEGKLQTEELARIILYTTLEAIVNMDSTEEDRPSMACK